MTRSSLILSFILLGGCQTIGTPDGGKVPLLDPNALRREAIVAQGQADTYGALAEEAAGFWDRTFQLAESGLDAVGAPAALSALVGGLAGLAVPTPGQRRRERLAAAEGRREAPAS